ncbi:uncharacterized protein LOC131614114 [Vicia villosa]|uniref:uncharacterized protein LOC131614114 n=1 Tax=Vicia villosa TaxID=3911 RepID=UPI00273C4242|nr:uncharacterized protein LOC131614114 [Vicia villosa]
MRWVNDGDINSNFFHHTMKERRNRNHIGSINSNGGLVTSVREVKEAVKVHFENKFKEECVVRPYLDGVHIKSLSGEECLGLEVPFLESEIREVVWSCDGAKSPGPDGLTFLFFRRCWSFLKSDVLKCLNDFYYGAILSKSITSSFLLLIPKSSNPLCLEDYRPICLIDCIHKIISMILAGRIKKILSSIISDCQSAFIPGRHMIDGVLVANELVDYSLKEGKDCLLFKVDFEKAYDKVSWNFFRYMMRRMGFGDRWMKWMEALVFSSKISVLVNGSPTREFGVERGLRQGDPISPFLFVIVAEGLKCLINKAVDNGDYVGCHLNGKCFVDVLQFADGTLLIGDGSWKHLWAIKAVLKGFELGVEEKRKIHWISWKEVCLPLEKGGFGLRSLEEFNIALLLKWNWRILKASNSLWYRVLKARYENINLKALVGEPKHIPRANRSVWWSNILSLRKYLPKGFFANNIKFEVGRGHSIPFWHAAWLDVGILKQIFPALFYSSLLQDVAISGMGGWVLGQWRWGDLGVHSGAGSEARELLPFLQQLLPASLPCETGPDSASWVLEKDGLFSVASCFNEMSKLAQPFGPVNRYDFIYSLVWKVEVPLKVKAFGWRCFKNKIPTKNLLLNRGISLSSSNIGCVFCEETTESSKHLLLDCRKSEAVWNYMASWIGMNYEKPYDVMESYWNWSSFCHKKKVRRGKEGSIWLAIVWSIRLNRNDIIFKNSSCNVIDLVWSCKLLVWRWSFIGKINHPNCNFYEFCKSPLYYLS